MTDKFISELPTGTIDSIRASVALELGMPTGTLTIQSSLAQMSQFMSQYGYFTGTYRTTNGFISENSAQLSYITGSSYRVEAGSASVNNQMLVWSSPLTRTGLSMTSGTMNYVYLYTSGTNTPALEESTTTPVWDSAFQYFKKTGDASRRCIGWIHGNASNQIRLFVNKVYGRVSEIIYLDVTDFVNSPVVNLGTSTSSWASFSMPMAPSHATDWWCSTKIVFTSDGEDAILGVSPADLGSVTAGFAPYTVRASAGKASTRTFFGRAWLPIMTEQTNYYRLTQSSGAGTSAAIECQGARIIR